MSEPFDYGDHDFDQDDGGEELGAFTEEDCGRWLNGRLSPQCRLAGTEDCDWDCPIGLGGKL